MAKKKSSGGSFGLDMLTNSLRSGIAWSGRFLTEFVKNLKYIYSKFLTYNTQFDNWCVNKNGKVLDPISKSLLIILTSLVVIPITIFWSFLRSF